MVVNKGLPLCGGTFFLCGYGKVNIMYATSIFLLLHLIGPNNGLRLTNMTAPAVADPREDMQLQCRFDMGKEELYAVKWYKDDDEFFRYTPGVQRQTILFPVEGVKVIPESKGGSICRHDRCDLVLTSLNREHSSGAYRCEVSSEAPAFRLASETRNITVAALPNEKPRLEGLSESYVIGDILTATCISAPGDPKPALTFFLNKQKAPVQYVRDIVLPSLSNIEEEYLKSRAVQLRLQIDRKHLLQRAGKFEITCVSTVPGISETLAPPLSTSKSVTLLLDHHQQLINNQKLHWPNSAASSIVRIWEKCLLPLIILKKWWW